jgi:hypothetical protein
MFPARNGIAYGISSGPDVHSELYLWADNQTDATVNLYFCCVSSLFDHIDIFDSGGHRVLSKADQLVQKVHSEGRESVDVCSCSGWSSVPPHTIQLFVFADIYDAYTLGPGHYVISERNPPGTLNLKPDDNQDAPYAPSGVDILIP